MSEQRTWIAVVVALLAIVSYFYGLQAQSKLYQCRHQAPPLRDTLALAKNKSDAMAESGKRPKVLVTGAAGFIGSHVVKWCAEDMGYDVVAVDDLSGGFKDNVPDHPRVVFMQGDVQDLEFVQSLFKGHKFVYIYHLAAYAAEGLSHFIRRFNYNNNLVAGINLYNAALNNGVRCFVFTSSIAAMGPASVPMVETDMPMPEDPYGVSKYAMELDLKSGKHVHDMDFIIFRPHNVYGPNQNIADKFRNVVGIFMNELLRGEPLTLFGDGLQTRAFSYIDNVASVIAAAPEVPEARNEVFFVGSDTASTVLKVAELVSKSFGATAEMRFLPARKEVVHAWADHSKMRCFFNPPPETSLEEGIKRSAEWVLERHRGSGFTPTGFGEIEVPKNLPPSWMEFLDETSPHWRGT